jgi:Type IV secretion-system coupling protein DNA-binding domain
VLSIEVMDPARAKVVTAGVTDEMVRPVRDREGRPIRNEANGGGYVFAWNSRPQGELLWRKVRANDRQMIAWMQAHTYEGKSFFGLLFPSCVAGLLLVVVGTGGMVVFDLRLNKRYEEGKFLRGSRLVEPEEFAEKFPLKPEAAGLGVPSLGMKKRGWLRREDAIYWLRVPKEEEAAHTTLLGDTGTGKSQLIHLFLWQIARRRPQEAVIVYDPAGEFLASHFRAERGDIVLNPLDARSPYWNPAAEVRLRTDYDLIAESFFPGSDSQRGTTNGFFVEAARNILARLLEDGSSPRMLVEWLANEDEIDRRVRGSELAHLIDPDAPQQRGGVLGTLSETGKKLRMLPRRDECEGEISLTEWAAAREGWIFVTSTQDTRSRLRLLHAVFLDLLMKRLTAVEPHWGTRHPCWLIVDEAHALGRMPALYLALTEGRKFGVKIIVGTQNKTQFEEKYGQGAATMLSQSVIKIAFRSNEPDSAAWVSRLLGEEEFEKPRTGVTASVSDHGRDSINYSSTNERKPVVSREEIMALKKLHGFWKYQDMVAPFRFDARNWPQRTARFVPRQAMLAGSCVEELAEEREEFNSATNVEAEGERDCQPIAEAISEGEGGPGREILPRDERGNWGNDWDNDWGNKRGGEKGGERGYSLGI